MSTRYLEHFFKPRSIAVLGASEKELSMGGVVLRNLIAAGFKGNLTAINVKGYQTVHDVPCHRNLADMPEVPDLAIICTMPPAIPRLVEESGRKGVKAVLILTGGLSRSESQSRGVLEVAFDLIGLSSDKRRTTKDSVVQTARKYGLRLMGPNCIGVIAPGHHMNASYAHLATKPGSVAFVGQSGILGMALLDWAHDRGIGFSHFTTLGDSLDVHLPDVIDYLSTELKVHAVLLHIEKLHEAGGFISSVRAASRNKLVLCIKSGRYEAARSEQEPETPGLRDSDMVYDAIFRRAGVLRVGSSEELFDALETLTRIKRMRGDRLAIMCNGVGPNLLASDTLLAGGLSLAEFSEETTKALKTAMPSYSNSANPLDICADASPERYAKAMEIIDRDPGVDALLVMHAPTLRAPGEAVAQAVIETAGKMRKNVLTTWMGLSTIRASRQAFDAAGLPTYSSPEKAVQAFIHMVRYGRIQEITMQTPPMPPNEHSPDQRRIRGLVQGALKEKRDYLNMMEAREIMDAYDFPMSEVHYARNREEAMSISERTAEPVALRILHERSCRPFQYEPADRWRWLAMDLDTPEHVAEAVDRIHSQALECAPKEHIQGYAVQRMYRAKAIAKFCMGITVHPSFGPLILFGRGGAPSDLLADRHVALPPLNMSLALNLVQASNTQNLLRDAGGDLRGHSEKLAGLLVKLSQLVIDVPEIRGLEMNPVLLTAEGLNCLEVTISLGEPVPLAIQPYPRHLCERLTLPKSGRMIEIRPIRGEDEPAHRDFTNRLTPESIRFRFFHNKKFISHLELARLTQIDYAREMAFIACTCPDDGTFETLGVVRAWIGPDNDIAEFAIIVRDDQAGQGLGSVLMGKLINYCRDRGIAKIQGQVLPENAPMLALTDKLGFSKYFDAVEGAVTVTLKLEKPKRPNKKKKLDKLKKGNQEKLHR